MKTARKILTIATSLAATTTLAAADAKPPAHWNEARSTTAVLIDGQPYMVTPGKQPEALSYAEYGRFLGETQPLVGPDGRPGCGNILSKGTPPSCVAARTEAVTARIAAAAKDKAAAAREAANDSRWQWRVTEAALAAGKRDGKL